MQDLKWMLAAMSWVLYVFLSFTKLAMRAQMFTLDFYDAMLDFIQTAAVMQINPHCYAEDY